MPGARPALMDQGTRSELLAHYFFSNWGPCTPVPHQYDHGIDMYCTLTEVVGKRAWVRQYYSVQVKSTHDAWNFESAEAVRWLVEHPVPLFLCVVAKNLLEVSIYQVMPRFNLWILGNLPDALELIPEDATEGKCVQWTTGRSYSLSAPILRATIADMTDKSRMKKLRTVFDQWVRVDQQNCDLKAQKMQLFRMPYRYTTNEVPSLDGESRTRWPSDAELYRGVASLLTSLDLVGEQVGYKGDKMFALRAALLSDWIRRKYLKREQDIPSEARVSGSLGDLVNSGLNAVLKAGGVQSHYLYAGLDALEKSFLEIPIVKGFLEPKEEPEPGTAGS